MNDYLCAKEYPRGPKQAQASATSTNSYKCKYQQLSTQISKYHPTSTNIKQYKWILTIINTYHQIRSNINEYQQISININNQQASIHITKYHWIIININKQCKLNNIWAEIVPRENPTPPKNKMLYVLCAKIWLAIRRPNLTYLLCANERVSMRERTPTRRKNNHKQGR